MIIVIDTEKNIKNSYHKWQWNLAWWVVYIFGILTGVIL